MHIFYFGAEAKCDIFFLSHFLVNYCRQMALASDYHISLLTRLNTEWIGEAREKVIIVCNEPFDAKRTMRWGTAIDRVFHACRMNIFRHSCGSFLVF